MKETVRRPARTAVQLGLAAAILAFVDAFSPVPLTPAQVGALGALLTILVSTAQNLLEDQNVIPPLLKGPPPPEPAVTRELLALATAIGELRNELRDRAASLPSGTPPGRQG